MMARPSPASASAIIHTSTNIYTHCPCRISRQILRQHSPAALAHQYPRNSIQRQHSRPFTSPSPRRSTHPQYEPRGLGDFYNDLLAGPLPTVAQRQRQSPPVDTTSPAPEPAAVRVQAKDGGDGDNTPDATALPDWVASGGRAEIEERARKLFGSIEGSGYQRTVSETPDETWRTINGVPVPPRPAEPENCCMSGCVHCVWDDYRDDVESWAMRLREAQVKGKKKPTQHDGGEEVTNSRRTPKIDIPRAEVNAASGSMDDDGGGSEALWQTPSPPAATSSASGDGDVDADALFRDIPIGIREFMATEKKIRERKRSKKLAEATSE